MKIRSLKTAGMAVAAALALASPLAAAETTLRAITAFQPGTTFAKPAPANAGKPVGSGPQDIHSQQRKVRQAAGAYLANGNAAIDSEWSEF